MSCDEQLEEAQRENPCLSRHEPVPQPEGQSASRPECLVTQPCPDCYSRPRASRSSSLGRGVGLVFLLCAPSFSSLFCRFFRAGFSGVVLKQGVRGSHFGHPRGGVVVPHLRVAVRFSPTREGSGNKSTVLRPKNGATLQVSPSIFGSLLGIAVFIYLLDVLGLRFLTLPAVTSAIEVLTQTHRSSGVVQWPACWAHNPKVRKEQSYMSACRIVPTPRVRW